MTNTPNLGLPYLDAAQSQKHVTHNEAIRALDALVQLAVIDQHLAAPPASPGNGDRYIIAAGGAGAWAGFDLQVAAFQDGAWAFHPPQKGWLAWVTSDGGLFGWNGAAWSLVGGVPSVNPVALVGINATADLTNRLAVKSPAILFDNTGGGMQAKINKAHPGDTASLLFQDGYSGRAEFGLTGDDNLHIKVSSDGAVWNEAILINAASGAVSLPHTPPLQVNADWNAGPGLAQILNKPAIPAAYTLPAATAAVLGGIKAGSGLAVAADGTLSTPVQANSDWNAATGVAQILNKPAIPAAYTLPAATAAILGGIKAGSGLAVAADGTLSAPVQANSDWIAATGVAQILNKPVLAAVAVSGAYADLSGRPAIPASPVNADWNAGSGLAQILNKPAIPAAYTLPAATAAVLGGIKAGSGVAVAADGTLSSPVQANSDWNAATGIAQILNKPVLAPVAISGAYADLSGKPAIPASPVNADWNAGSGLAQILNKPSIPVAYTLPAATSAALGGVKSGSGLAVAADGTLTTPVHDAQARHFLRRWMGKTALLQQNLTTTRAVMAFIGDSWVYNDFITNPLKRTLQTRYGNAGPGYCTLAPIGANPPETSVVTAGTWAITGAPSQTAGVDLNYVLSSDVASPAKKTITAQGTDFVVHYFVQPGGGSFTWQIDGGAATTISTAGGALAYATLTISGQTNASHALALTVTVAGTAGVILCGVDVQIAVPGVRLHRIGATGQQVSGYLNATSQAIWSTGLAALNPDTVFIVFGTNETNANTLPATFAANLTTLIGWVRAAVPLADIVLMTPTDNGITGTTYTMLDYSAAMGSTAAANNCGFLNAYLDMGPYANANAMGLYQNLGHLNQYGGQMVANLALNYLQNGVFPNTVASPGTRNFFLSLNAGDPSFAGGGARGAGALLTTGTDNVGIGQALANVTSGSSNTAMGSNAANALATGTLTAFGAGALQLAVTSTDSSAFGVAALQKTTANGNSAFGANAGVNVSTGAGNSLFGAYSGAALTTGGSATLIGYNAGASNVIGANMTALGRNAAVSATSDNVTALGNGAGLGLTTGDANTMVGQNAGSAVSTGRANTIVGRASGSLATLANNIILADGDGNIGLQIDNARVARTNAATFILGSKTTITGGGTTLAPTLTTGPKAGNPTKWLPYDDNGVTRYIPAW